MPIVKALSCACIVALIPATFVVAAQQSQSPLVASPTTRLMPVSGTLTDAVGTPLAGAQTITLTLFDEAEGGTLLWSEVQTVTADDRGRYIAYLGAGASLPLDNFRSEQARWLQVSVAGRDLPRVMLVAVPYALKAADAETVGGKPASAFVLASDQPARGTGTPTIGALAIEPLATSGIPGYIGMFTSTTDLGNSMMYQSGIGIGVNTSAPEVLFNVRSEQTPAAFFDVYSNTLGALPVVYRAARGTAAAPLPVQTNDILGGLAVRGYAPSGFTGGKGQVMFRAAENWTDTANGTLLQFMTTPTGSTTFAERMRITPDGQVAIGATNPVGARLRVVASGTTDGISGETSTPGGTGVRGFSEYSIGVRARSNSGTALAAEAGSAGTALLAVSTFGTALQASSSGTTIAIFTGPGGNVTFSGSGNVGIGTTSPVDKLDARGDIRVGTGSTGCVKDANGTVIAGVCSSDLRFKRAVTPFARSLDAVARLQPVYFTWRADEFPDRHFGRTPSFGLIAQDVEAVLPDLVTTDAEGYKAVKYNQLPFYMLQAIKDLKAENDALNQKMKAQDLKVENDSSKKQLQVQDQRLRRLEAENDALKQQLRAQDQRLRTLEQIVGK